MSDLPPFMSSNDFSVKYCACSGGPPPEIPKPITDHCEPSPATTKCEREGKHARKGSKKNTKDKTFKVEKKDPFVRSELVYSLDGFSFNNFISDKDAVLVMFYDPASPDCDWSRKHFRKAALTTIRDNHAYAAVNCDKEPQLCKLQDVNNYPFFRLYAKGYTVGTVKEARSFPYQTMRTYVENTPVFNVPAPP